MSNPGGPVEQTPTQSPERRCPNCGYVIPANLPYCSVCGYGLKHTQLAPGKGGGGSVVAWTLLFIFIGLPAALCGGCGLLVGYQDASMFAMGLVGIAVFVGLLIGLIRANRKPPTF